MYFGRSIYRRNINTEKRNGCYMTHGTAKYRIGASCCAWWNLKYSQRVTTKVKLSMRITKRQEVWRSVGMGPRILKVSTRCEWTASTFGHFTSRKGTLNSACGRLIYFTCCIIGIHNILWVVLHIEPKYNIQINEHNKIIIHSIIIL
jgi:hypothetical protein